MGTSLIAEHLLKKLQQGIARVHPTVELGNCCAAVPDLVSFQQHRSIGQSIAASCQLSPQGMVSSPVTDFQIGKASLKFGALRKGTAERAAAVVDEGQCHRRIVPCKH